MKRSLSSLLLLCAVAPIVMAQSGGTKTVTQYIEAAQQAQARQDCSTAAKEYSAAVRLMPSSAELRTNQAIALYCDGRFHEAIPALQKALTLKSDLTVPHLFLGLSYFQLSDRSAAIKELETAVQQMPSDLTANLWLGYAYLANQQNERAIQSFDAALRLQPQNVDARYALGQAYFDIGRQRTLDLVKLEPKGRGIQLLIAQQHALKNGNAVKEAHGITTTWKSAEEEKLYSDVLAAEQEAQAALQQIIAKAPESDRSYEIQGDAYSLQRNNEAAIAEYNEVIRINPTLPGVRIALANCLMQVGRFGEALAAVQQEQHLTPNSADVWAFTGRVQLALGKDGDAMESLKKAANLPGASPAVQMLLGKSLLRNGDAKGALAHLQKALREGADPANTNYLLARAYRATGDRIAMARSLEAYRQSSQDEAERQAATALTENPATLQTNMSSQEVSEASNMRL